MTEKQMINEELEKANTRRSKKEQEGRDFLCGCSKKYLSYNALYTHVKIKHDGVQPEGTFRAPTVPLPKKSKQEKQKQALRQMQSQTSRDDYLILTQLDVQDFGMIPQNERITKSTASPQIYDCYKNLLKEQELKITNTSSLDVALTVYLFNAGQYVTNKVYYFYLLFAKTARNCYYDYGEDIYKSYFSNKEQAGAYYLPTFSTLEVRYFPIVVDFLIMGYITEIQDLEVHEDVAVSMLQLIIQDFCNWIFRKQLTKMKIKMLKDYQLTDKPSSLKVKQEEEQMDIQKLYHSTALQNKRQKYQPRDVSIAEVEEEEESEYQQYETGQKRSYEDYINENGENQQQIQ